MTALLLATATCRPGTHASEASPVPSTLAAAPTCPTGTSLVAGLCVREGMIAIPAADVVVGPQNPAGNAPLDRAVHVSAFQIDRTEVTTAAYAACVRAGACERPWPYRADYDDVFLCNYGKSARVRHPMNCVGPRAAETYCGWMSKRLPSSEEWEYAARGNDHRAYPWGEGGARAYENCLSRPTGLGTCEAGSHPHDASPFGVLDMMGNVEEWTRSPRPAWNPKMPGPFLAVHGGAYASDGPSWNASGYSADVTDVRPTGGFRCVADAAEALGSAARAASAPSSVDATAEPRRAANESCAAPMSRCDGGCVDTRQDNGHCGGCGGFCDGTCIDGRCAIELASFHGVASALAANGRDVFWRARTPHAFTVEKVRATGGAPVTLATRDGDENYGPLAVDATDVYWTERGRIVKMSVGGGERFTVATTTGGIQGLAVDTSGVFWTTGYEGALVMKVARDGGAPSRIASYDDKQLSGLTLDDSHVYVMAGEIFPTWIAYSVMATSKQGGASVLVPGWGEAGLGALAMDETTVYWPEGQAGADLRKRARRGGKEVHLASWQNRIGGVAVDASNVYWTVEGECRSKLDCDGIVMKMTPK